MREQGLAGEERARSAKPSPDERSLETKRENQPLEFSEFNEPLSEIRCRFDLFHQRNVSSSLSLNYTPPPKKTPKTPKNINHWFIIITNLMWQNKRSPWSVFDVELNGLPFSVPKIKPGAQKQALICTSGRQRQSALAKWWKQLTFSIYFTTCVRL